ncbi:MAG TPA: DUF5317 family protein [Mycobacteriales bacterium]
MLFVLIAVVGGLLIGWALGGSLSRLETARLRYVPVLLLAVALQVAAAFALGGWAYAAVLVVSLLLALGWLAFNGRLAGRLLLAVGLAANALVIVANGAMPVELSAAARAGVATGPLYDDPRHAVADGSTRLALLDDRIPLPLPWQPQVLSAGDVLVAAGAGLMVAQAMRRRVRGQGAVLPPPPGGPAVSTGVPPPPPGRPQMRSD